MISKRLPVGFLLAIVLSLTTLPAARAQEPRAMGAIDGRVTDAGTGEPLPGARVVATGTASEASTDRDGRFVLAAVPAGDRTVVVSYLGRKDQIVDTTVTAGGVRHLEVTLAVAAFEESVTVAAQALIVESQERALNQQKTAPNIHQHRIGGPDRILPGSECRRNDAADSRRVDYQGPG
jgi:hypothetical protein